MTCPDCSNTIPPAHTQCPHCGRPAVAYPNVVSAEEPSEILAVQKRHAEAMTSLAATGCGVVGAEFENAVAQSRAVIGRPMEEALRLVKADNAGYATFYELLHAGVILPNDDRWTRLRGLADWELFRAARDEIRFASLSLDGKALANYGAVSLELSDDMISHRATVFEENSALFFEKQRQQGNEPPIVAGHRARWCDRGKLAVAKHAAELTASTTSAAFASILLRQGATSADDVFVEVHIHGPLTRRSLKRVIVHQAQARAANIDDLRDRLAEIGVDFQVQ